MTIPSTGRVDPGNYGNTRPLAGKKICIDPGHGGSDSGAIGITGLKEKDVNLDISLRLEKDLVNLGATVYMTRTGDTEVAGPGASRTEELQARCDVATKNGVDVFLCIHNNAWTDPNKSGMEVYVVRQAGGETKRLAGAVYEKLKALPTKPNGILEAGFYVLNHTSMPGILTETAYVSNAKDEALLKTPEFREQVAGAIAQGVKEFLQHPTAPLDPEREDLKPHPAPALPLDLPEEQFLLAGPR